MALADWEIELSRLGFEPVSGEQDNFSNSDFLSGMGDIPDFQPDPEKIQGPPAPIRRAGRRTRASLELERANLPTIEDPSFIRESAPLFSPNPVDNYRALFGNDEKLGLVDRVGLGLSESGESLKQQFGGLRQVIGEVPDDPEVRKALMAVNPGLAVGLSALGNTQEGLKLSRAARKKQAEIHALSDVGDGKPDMAGDFLQDFTTEVVSSAAPSIAGGVVAGPAGMIVAAGAQSAGAFMDHSVQGWMDQGYDEADAVRMARPVAVLAGAITAGLTKLMPGGTEALVNRILSGSIPRGSARKIVFDVAKEALKEFPEEFADQTAQGIAEKMTFNPEKPIWDIVRESFQAGALGSVIGLGLGGGASVLPQSRAQLNQERIDNAVDRARQIPPALPGTIQPPTLPVEAPVEVPSAPAPAAETSAPIPNKLTAFYPENPQVYLDAGFSGEQTVAYVDAAKKLNSQMEPTPLAVAPAAPSVEQAPVADLVPGAKPTLAQLRAAREAAVAQPAAEPAAVVPEVGLSRAKRGRQNRRKYEDQLPDDLINWVEGNQRLRKLTRKELTQIDRGEPLADETLRDIQDLYAAAQRAYPKAFTDNGSAPDTVAQAYTDSGRKEMNAETLLQTISDNAAAREGFIDRLKKDEQAQNFDEVVVRGERKDQKRIREIKSDELAVGDTFKVQKQEFVVDSVQTDPNDETVVKSVTLKDGKKFGETKVAPGVTLNIDKRSLRRANKFTEADAMSFGEDVSDVPDIDAGDAEADATDEQYGRELEDEGSLRPEPAVKAKGITAIRSLIAASKMPPKDKAIALAMLDNPAFQNAVWDNLEVQFSDDLPGNLAGSQRGWLVKVREAGGPQVLPEEIFHVVYNLLPESDKQAIEAARREALPEDAPDSIREGTMTTQEFIDAKPSPELYQYRTASEYMAMMFSDKVARESVPEGTWERIQRFFKGIIDSIKRAVGLESQMDGLYRRVLAGEFKPTPQSTFNQNVEGAVPYFAARFDPETLMQRPAWVEPGSKLDQVLGELREKNDPSIGRDIAPIWKTLTPAQRQDLAARGWITTASRDPRVVALKVAQDVVAARKYFAMQSKRVSPDTEGSYSRRASSAENAEQFAKIKNQEGIEGRSQSSQGVDILGFLEKHGVLNSAPSIQAAFKSPKWKAIAAVGERLLGKKQGYRDVKAQPTEAWEKSQFAKEAGNQILSFDETLNARINDGLEAKKEMDGPALRRKLDALDEKLAAKQLRESNVEVERSIVGASMKRATDALSEQGKNDVEIARLQGEINGMEEAQTSSVAMERLLDDMTSTLLSTSDGETALQNGESPRTLASLYRQTKRALDQPVTNDNLIRWASYLMSKSPELRENLWALELARDGNIRRAMNTYQQKLMADLRSNPTTAVQTLLRNREKSITQMNKAEWAWNKLNKGVTNEIAKLQRKIDAGEMAGAIRGDEEYQSLRTEILKDFGYVGDQRPKPFQSEPGNGTFTNANGRSIDLTNATMVGSKRLFEAKAAEMEQWMEENDRWLEANPDDVNWQRFRHIGEVVRDYYGTHSVINANDKIGLFKWAMSIPQKVADRVGGRFGAPLRKALSQWDRVHLASRRISDNASAELGGLMIKAMSSHGIKWGAFNKQGLGAAASQYASTVLNELNASWQRQGGGLEVGDTLESGQEVTPEDIAYVEAEAKWALQAMRTVGAIDNQVSEDTLAATKGKNFRSALQTVRYMMPRMFNYDLGKLIDPKFAEKFRSGDLRGVETALDEAWALVGQSLISDRDPQFAKMTVFDENGAFERIANQLRGDQNSVQSVDDLANQLADLSDMEPEEAKEIVLQEFGRIISNWKTAVDGSQAAANIDTSKSGDTKNSFTQSRDMALAPHAFYRVGFHNTDDVTRFAAGMHSVPRDRVADALRAIVTDIERQETDLKRRTLEMQRQGVENPERSARMERKLARQNGETFDSFEDLEGRKAAAQKALDRLTADRMDDGYDYMTQRIVGDFVGALVANSLTTLRNVSGIYLGRTLRNSGMGWARSVLMAAYYTLDSATRVAAATGYEIPPMFWRMASNLQASLKDHPEANKAKKLYAHVIREIIRTFSDKVPRRLKTVRHMENMGTLNIPDRVAEWDNQVFGSMWSKGRIPAKDLTTAQKVALSPLVALFETVAMPVLTSAFPFLGDLTANQAVALAMKSRFGPQLFGNELDDVFERYKDGKRALDLKDGKNPLNRLTGQELEITNDMLAQRRRMFEQAGMDFDAKAIEYLRQREAGAEKPAFLTDTEIDRLTSTGIDLSNRSAPSNSPLALQENTKLAKAFAPLMGWPTRMAGVFTQMMSIPVQTGKEITNEKDLTNERLKQVMYAMTFVMLAALMAGGASKIPEEYIARAWKKIAFNQETSARMPWEEETKERRAWAFTRMAMESVPFLSVIGNGVIPANMPARASYTPSLVVLSIAEGIMNYVNGVRASGDPTYRLNDLIARTIPDTKAVLNRMERFSGSRDRDNMVAMAKRFGPTDLVRPPYRGGATPNINELTPYWRNMENAAMNGNRDEFVRLYNEAITKATELGRPDPEKTVSQGFNARNPTTAAFTAKLTGAQHSAMLNRMEPQDREKFVAGEKAFQQAAEWVDLKTTPTFEKQETRSSSGASRARTGGTISRQQSTPFGSSSSSSSRGSSSVLRRVKTARTARVSSLRARTSRAASRARSRSSLRRARRPRRTLRRL